MDDDLALPVMDGLRVCLCAQLEDSPGGTVCSCTLVPGQRVPADFCTCSGTGAGCGQAWVRLVRIFPYGTFPQQDIGLQKCTGPLAATIELGVYRCLPTTGNAGQPPTPVAQVEATRVQLGDWQAMRRTLKCCDILDHRMVSLGAYEPRSVGGCGGGVLTATIQLGRVR